MSEPSKLKQVSKILTVEPYLFFIFISFMVKQNTFTQFFQDKICVISYNRTAEECYFLTSTKKSQYQDVKANILKDANVLASYQAILRSMPGILFTILLAPWADKVKGARRKLMIWSAIGQILDAIFGMIAVMHEDTWPPWTAVGIGIPSAIAGGLLSVNIAAMGYVSMTTPPTLMSLRFIILETVINASRPTSSYISGQLLATTSWIPNKVRNFTALYALVLISASIALVWSLIYIDDSDRKPEKLSEETKYQFFNRDNLFQLINTMTRQRKNKGRIQLWLLVVINALSISVLIGTAVVDLSFVQEVYGWDITKFSTTNSILTVSTLVAFGLGSPLLASWLKLTNPEIGLFGLTRGCLKIVTLGTVMKPWGFYVSGILGTYTTVTASAVKASISGLVEPSEKSSAFALMNIVQNMVALITTFYFQRVINATMTTMPGLCFQLSSIAFLVSMLCFAWIDFNTLKSVNINDDLSTDTKDVEKTLL